jgi:hypothetical protein
MIGLELLMSVAGLLLKATLTFVLGRLFGLSNGHAIETGLLLGQGGESSASP